VLNASIMSDTTALEWSRSCPVSQPIRRSRAAWPAVSTHSAVTVSPGRCASWTRVFTIAPAAGLGWKPLMPPSMSSGPSGCWRDHDQKISRATYGFATANDLSAWLALREAYRMWSWEGARGCGLDRDASGDIVDRVAVDHRADVDHGLRGASDVRRRPRRIPRLSRSPGRARDQHRPGIARQGDWRLRRHGHLLSTFLSR
jgi:hypothetical protein